MIPLTFQHLTIVTVLFPFMLHLVQSVSGHTLGNGGTYGDWIMTIAQSYDHEITCRDIFYYTFLVVDW